MLQDNHTSSKSAQHFCGLAFVANPIHLLADIQKVELGRQRLDT